MKSKYVIIIFFLAVVSLCSAIKFWNPEECGCPPFDKIENEVCTKQGTTYDNRCQFDCHQKFLSKTGVTLEEGPCIMTADAEEETKK
nr:venom protein U-MPTX.3-Mc9 [Megalopyge crispata]